MSLRSTKVGQELSCGVAIVLRRTPTYSIWNKLVTMNTRFGHCHDHGLEFVTWWQGHYTTWRIAVSMKMFATNSTESSQANPKWSLTSWWGQLSWKLFFTIFSCQMLGLRIPDIHNQIQKSSQNKTGNKHRNIHLFDPWYLNSCQYGEMKTFPNRNNSKLGFRSPKMPKLQPEACQMTDSENTNDINCSQQSQESQVLEQWAMVRGRWWRAQPIDISIINSAKWYRAKCSRTY